MISVNNLHLRSGTFYLSGISFSLKSGEYGVLMGKTGAGKTSILEAITGLKKLESGSIFLDDREVSKLKPAERNLGYVPQDRALFSTLTVHEHLAFALRLRRWQTPKIDRRVQEMASLLGIQPLLKRYPHGLSGGEGQRVALGRALSFHPNFLLLDEPLSALDEVTKEEMCSLLKRIQKETGVTILHVTHSLSEANRLANRLFVLTHGEIRERELEIRREENTKPTLNQGIKLTCQATPLPF